MDIIDLFFFNFRFSSRKSQRTSKKAKNLAKKITHFTIQFCSMNIAHFKNFNLLDIENNMLPQNSQKPFWLYKFSVKMFLFGVRKNICTATFLDAQELHCWSTLKANVCIFLHISLRKFLFQICSKVLSGKEWDGRGWITSLRQLAVPVLQNVLQFFILIGSFENSTTF